jgi:hypothetical protein
MNTMFIKDQILTSTNIDLQGEKVDLKFLEELIRISPSPILLHQHHNPILPVVGKIENLRVVNDPRDTSVYFLIGDVTIEKDVDTDFRGFSYSVTLGTHKKIVNNEDPLTATYIPFPYYNQETLIDDMLDDSSSSAIVGKWIKKGTGLEPLAIILIKPVVTVLAIAVGKKVVDKILDKALDKAIENSGALVKRALVEANRISEKLGRNKINALIGLCIKINDQETVIAIVSAPTPGYQLTDKNIHDIYMAVKSSIARENILASQIKRIYGTIKPNGDIIIVKIECPNGEVFYPKDPPTT